MPFFSVKMREKFWKRIMWNKLSIIILISFLLSCNHTPTTQKQSDTGLMLEFKNKLIHLNHNEYQSIYCDWLQNALQNDNQYNYGKEPSLAEVVHTDINDCKNPKNIQDTTFIEHFVQNFIAHEQTLLDTFDLNRIVIIERFFWGEYFFGETYMVLLQADQSAFIVVSTSEKNYDYKIISRNQLNRVSEYVDYYFKASKEKLIGSDFQYILDITKERILFFRSDFDAGAMPNKIEYFEQCILGQQ